jgi:uncharacterized membrane protein YGL010W
MFFGRSWDAWIADYERGHHHPFNRAAHAFGIPMIVVSMLLLLVGVWSRGLLLAGVALFVAGWILQFAGHMAERKPPEFFHDWRFLLVGVRGWYCYYWRVGRPL